jgi:uncharacterized DUF497 family protein
MSSTTFLVDTNVLSELTRPRPDVRVLAWALLHSEDELRFLSLGKSEAGRLFVVAYTERQGRIRIISAREATPKERREYESEAG